MTEPRRILPYLPVPKGGRATAPLHPIALSLVVILLLLGGCGGAPAKGRLSGPAVRPEGPGAVNPLPHPVPAPPPPAIRPVPTQVVEEEAALREARVVRVLLEGRRRALDIFGERVRILDGAGRPLGEWSGKVVVEADGDLLRMGEGAPIPGPVEAEGVPALSVGGRRVACRVRLHAKGGALIAVACLPLESYVSSVLSREAAPSFHAEALKAMAVAIRSYTLSSLAAPKAPEYDLLPGVENQVFDGDHAVPRSFGEAAESTAGTVILRDGSVARAVYHSTCGGRTEGAADAWEGGGAWPPSVACEDCRHSPAWRWVFRMGDGEVARVFLALGVRGERDFRLEPRGHTPTGRVTRLLLSAEGKKRERKEVKAPDFRRTAGYGKVKSLAFEVRRLPGGGMIFSGKGYGHGVGLCQWGADGMARRGASMAEILARYYPGAATGAAPR